MSRHFVSSYDRAGFVGVLMETYGRVCFYCGNSLTRDTVTVEHLIPSAEGGDTSVENCRPACRRCNNGVGALSVEAKRQVAIELRKLGRFDMRVVNQIRHISRLIDPEKIAEADDRSILDVWNDWAKRHYGS